MSEENRLSISEIVTAGREMRKAQKLYFEKRTQANLVAAKLAERTFDRLLERVQGFL